MKIFVDLLTLLGILIVFAIVVYRTRLKLLKMWKVVSIKEVIFHKILFETVLLYSQNKVLFKEYDTDLIFKKLAKYRRKRLRHLLLKERQDLFLSLNALFLEIEERNEDNYLGLKRKFKDLQAARRLYNSKVLIYNQTISVFPTRYLAIKLNLKIKEYFG
ncbi:MAG: hypothetical protein QM489_04085 [Candidatus Izemoplasma sp.]